MRTLLCEIIYTEKDKYHVIFLICVIEKTNKRTQNKPILINENRLVVARGGVEIGELFLFVLA